MKLKVIEFDLKIEISFILRLKYRKRRIMVKLKIV